MTVNSLSTNAAIRWWWISFWAPTISVTIAGLLWYSFISSSPSHKVSSFTNIFGSDLQFHSFLTGILFGSLAGTLSHAIIWWNLIGYVAAKNN